MARREIIANCILSIDHDGDFVSITFGLEYTHAGRHAPQEVAAVMVTPRAYRDLERRIAQGPTSRSVN